MTNRLTINGSRIQPTPPVCRSKPAETLPAQHLPGQLAVIGIMIYKGHTVTKTQQAISTAILPTPWGDSPPVPVTLADLSIIVWQITAPTPSTTGRLDVTVTNQISGTTIATATLPPTYNSTEYDSFNVQLRTATDLLIGIARVTIQ